MNLCESHWRAQPSTRGWQQALWDDVSWVGLSLLWVITHLLLASLPGGIKSRVLNGVLASCRAYRCFGLSRCSAERHRHSSVVCEEERRAVGMCGRGRSDKSCASMGQLCWFSEEMAETRGNRSAPGFILYGQENSLGCVSLTEKSHFYHFIGSQTVRITFTHCPFLFKLVVMSCLVMFAQCFILLSSSVASSCALSLALFLCLLHFSPLVTFLNLFFFSFLLSHTLSSLCPACSLFVWLFGKEEGIYSSHWILLPTVPPIWLLWILQSMTPCQIVMLP